MRSRLPIAAAAALAAACASPRGRSSETPLTSAALAQSAAHRVNRSARNGRRLAPDLTAVDSALMHGDYGRALVLTDEALRGIAVERERGWFEEARGQALVGLGRTREALRAFERAVDAFTGEPDPARVRLRALFGEARALREAGLCDEAARAWKRFAGAAPEDAAIAQSYARDCPGPVHLK